MSKLGYGYASLNITPKTQTVKEIIDKLDLIKNLYSAKLIQNN